MTELVRLSAGVDEVGRGPLAGPVVAAAVILDSENPIVGLADSKKISAKRREVLARQIRRDSLCWAIGWADRAEIDALNILHATMLAMRRAILGLSVCPSKVFVDGNRLPNLKFDDCTLAGEAIVGGDDKVAAISAASIIAKVYRDHLLVELDRQYPGYGFAQHKGYGTRQHLAALRQLGACPAHRRSFRPISEMQIENVMPARNGLQLNPARAITA